MHQISYSFLQSLFSEEGLELLNLSRGEDIKTYESYQAWLKNNRHAKMAFLIDNEGLRRNPKNVQSQANTIISFGLGYNSFKGYNSIVNSNSPQIAAYARFDNYHKVLKKKGRKILAYLHSHFTTKKLSNPFGQVFTDTAPILERALAACGNMGGIGKNTCYIHKRWGSFILLGEIYTSLTLELDKVPLKEKGKDLCGECNLCQKHCPTQALFKPYSLDANRCLAYWTMEHRGVIPSDFWSFFRYYYFGCDICQLVCPHNSKRTQTKRLSPSLPLRNFPALYEIATMDQEFYEKHFGGSSLTRAKIWGLKRNALIALTVTKNDKLGSALDKITSNDHPVVVATKAQILEYLKKKPVSNPLKM